YLAVARDRFIQFLLPRQCHSQVVQDLYVIGRELQSSTITGFRLGILSLSSEYQSQVIVRVDIFGFELDGPAKADRRFIETAEFFQDNAEVVVRLGKRCVERHSSGKAFERTFDIFLQNPEPP